MYTNIFFSTTVRVFYITGCSEVFDVVLLDSGIMFGFMWLFDSWSVTDCLLFGAIISATDPGKVAFNFAHILVITA